mmetsp:Transcript_68865/g.208277  ORF Transcript_68865/g.208277 Transcript_68865/m.208277 type:complete len:233 (+) Transcript_68865:2-700(+)
MGLLRGAGLAGEGAHRRRDVQRLRLPLPLGQGHAPGVPPHARRVQGRPERRPEAERVRAPRQRQLHRALRRRRPVRPRVRLQDGECPAPGRPGRAHPQHVVQLRGGARQLRLRRPGNLPAPSWRGAGGGLRGGPRAVGGRRWCRQGSGEGSAEAPGGADHLRLRILVRLPARGCARAPLPEHLDERRLRVPVEASRAPWSAERGSDAGPQRHLLAHLARLQLGRLGVRSSGL